MIYILKGGFKPKMSDWQKEYKLIQHSPLIHFQHSEPHACLRATEVKPKLDRFLIEQAKTDPLCSNDKWKRWLIGDGSQQSFDYMMRITPNGNVVEKSQTIEIAVANGQGNIHKNYFGNMVTERGDDREAAIREKYKESLFFPDGITLTIRCFIPDLLAFIDKHIRVFFMLHNFGTRQRKGFGSFTVDIAGEENAPRGMDLIREYCPNAFFCKLPEAPPTVKQRLDAIWIISAFLKGGYNNPGAANNYIRGFVFRYFRQQATPIGNDKAFVKQNVLYQAYNRAGQGEHRPPLGPNAGYERYRYVRGLFGTNESSTFRPNGFGRGPDYKVFTRSSQGIERFPSPLLFKPIDGYVFIIPQKMPERIFGAEFYMIDERQYNRFKNQATEKAQLEYLRTQCSNGKILTPTVDELYPNAHNDPDAALHAFLAAFAKDFNDKNNPNKGGGNSINNLQDSNISPAKQLFIKPVKPNP